MIGARILRRAGLALVLLAALFAALRGAVEFVVIDYGHPASYASDWGGPSLAGVLAVHSLPGAVATVLVVRWWRRTRRGRAVGVAPAAAEPAGITGGRRAGRRSRA